MHTQQPTNTPRWPRFREQALRPKAAPRRRERRRVRYRVADRGRSRSSTPDGKILGKIANREMRRRFGDETKRRRSAHRESKMAAAFATSTQNPEASRRVRTRRESARGLLRRAGRSGRDQKNSWQREWLTFYERAVPANRFVVELIARSPLSSRVDRLRFDSRGAFDWMAGQHLVVVRGQGQALFLPYSIASANDPEKTAGNSSWRCPCTLART